MCLYLVSGKSFMNYIIHSTEDNLLSNKTHILRQETAILDEQNLKKITVIPIDKNQNARIPMKDEQLTLATEENRITTADTFTSTFFLPKSNIFFLFLRI
jgi:hypothetical protein